jgi:hypothetical protein
VIISETQTLSAQVVPNPAIDKATLLIEASKEANGILDLIDANGKNVRKDKLRINKGANSILLTGLNHLSKGVYILKLTTVDGTHYQKLIVQ